MHEDVICHLNKVTNELLEDTGLNHKWLMDHSESVLFLPISIKDAVSIGMPEYHLAGDSIKEVVKTRLIESHKAIIDVCMKTINALEEGGA